MRETNVYLIMKLNLFTNKHIGDIFKSCLFKHYNTSYVVFFKFADDPDDVVELPILMTGRY